MEQATTVHIQNQNQRQSQSNRQAVPATGNSQPDELKVLGMMMQQLLHGMQIQGNALNQVSTDINTRIRAGFAGQPAPHDPPTRGSTLFFKLKIPTRITRERKIVNPHPPR
ncbi:hypothetical protein F2Q70_00014891 [Brassica cretica]|uniref:Uncharacterized protein n=1 Tax=Brassica cretica TaxID=69181 RepID=A0A8S9HYH7_BRACR|nr:hypothetical protein F2Q70_00014891 [Brassica cretica]